MLTPSITTRFTSFSLDTAAVLSQMLDPRLLHADIVVNPVITGLAPEPYAPNTTGFPAVKLLVGMMVP